jgi:hypothetical protein
VRRVPYRSRLAASGAAGRRANLAIRLASACSALARLAVRLVYSLARGTGAARQTAAQALGWACRYTASSRSALTWV